MLPDAIESLLAFLLPDTPHVGKFKHEMKYYASTCAKEMRPLFIMPLCTRQCDMTFGQKQIRHVHCAPVRSLRPTRYTTLIQGSEPDTGTVVKCARVCLSVRVRGTSD